MPKAARSKKNTNGDSATPKKMASVTAMPSVAMSNLTSSMEEQIRQRAYELWEERGRQHGFAEQDWLRAEAEVLGRVRSA